MHTYRSTYFNVVFTSSIFHIPLFNFILNVAYAGLVYLHRQDSNVVTLKDFTNNNSVFTIGDDSLATNAQFATQFSLALAVLTSMNCL